MRIKSVGCVTILTLLLVAVVMAVLFPARRDPFVPLSTSLAIKGRGLLILIAQNQRRNIQNEKYVNPFLCSNATQFAKELLSMSSQTNETNLTESDIGIGLWNIAIDDLADYDSSFPLLISANFNLDFLKLDIPSDRVLPIGRKAGAALSLLDDRGIVIIMGNGQCQRIKAKYLTRDMIFLGKQNCHRESVTFLTPTGRIVLEWGGNHPLTKRGNNFRGKEEKQ